MKTEATEALRAMSNDLKYNVGVIHSNPQLILEESFISGVKYGQSNPKVNQLEWMEVNDCGEIGIEAKTPFGNYEVYEISDCSGFVLWWLDQDPHVFATEIEAKMYAQSDFERRAMECLEALPITKT